MIFKENLGIIKVLYLPFKDLVKFLRILKFQLRKFVKFLKILSNFCQHVSGNYQHVFVDSNMWLVNK